jgi:mannose-1-phosphate guanylyltransferase
MSGGVGSRFWPVSREERPKQFLRFLSGKSLIRETFEKVLPLVPGERIFVATGQRYVDLVRQELPEMSPSHILAEPVGKNTLPCIGVASAVIGRTDRDAPVLFLPSDHHVVDADAFRQALATALEYACRKNAILTIGIRPSRAETGFGYLRAGEAVTAPGPGRVFRVEAFTEKPDRNRALAFLESGVYYWNSGIFASTPSVMLGAIARHRPEMSRGIIRFSASLGTDREADALDEFYRSVDPVSIDYGIMEKEREVYMVEGTFRWSDLGSWESAYELAEKDAHGHAVLSGDLLSIDSRGCCVDARGKLVVMIGVEDLITVSTDDALLVCTRDRSQEVKDAVEILKKRGKRGLL